MPDEEGAWLDGMIVPRMTLVLGTQLGRYEIVSQLGSGGMGIVYEAHDPRLKRTVGIKLLPPELTRDETAKQRFIREAQAVAWSGSSRPSTRSSRNVRPSTSSITR